MLDIIEAHADVVGQQSNGADAEVQRIIAANLGRAAATTTAPPAAGKAPAARPAASGADGNGALVQRDAAHG